jgi:hypothetical protein
MQLAAPPCAEFAEPALSFAEGVGTMPMEPEGFANDWKSVASFIQFKISCYDQRECPAFENRESWGQPKLLCDAKNQRWASPRLTRIVR